MGGNRQLYAALVATAMLLALVPPAPGAAASSHGCGNAGCTFERQVAGDYWVGELEVLEAATTASGSTIEVTLGFDDRTDRAGFLVVLENVEDGSVPLGIVVWVKAVRDEVRVSYDPIVGDPVGLDVAPLGELAWDRIGATIQWNADQELGPDDHRLVVTGPTADEFDLEIDLDSEEEMRLGAEASGSTGPHGALVVEEAWDPAALIQAPGLKVLRDGQHAVDVPADRSLYAYHGPATGGAAAVDACFLVGGVCGAVAGASGTNWGQSVFGLERPDGTSAQREMSWPLCTFATCPGGPGPASSSFVLLDEAPGPWTFSVQEHQGVGTAPNMLAIVAPIQLPS